MDQPKTCSGAHAALAILVILQATMLAALLARTPPHPPLAVAPFALAPFLGTSIAVAVAALLLGAASTRAGATVSGLAAVLALVSFGPQKWLDPAIAQIWPAVFLGEIAASALLVLAIGKVRPPRANGQQAKPSP